ncbi:MAG: hypothetical protein R2716_00610 [Microthrixaceae bacterium]
MIERYSHLGRDVGDLDYYVAFGYWKLTCIIAGVYARYAGGAMGEVPEEQVVGFRHMLDTLAAQTEQAAGSSSDMDSLLVHHESPGWTHRWWSSPWRAGSTPGLPPRERWPAWSPRAAPS